MTQIRRHILVVGSVGADIVVEVNRMPARSETLSASKPDTGNVYPGGKGDNQAATIAKLIGPDHPTLIAKMACQFGNDTEKGSRSTCLSGLAFVFVYPDGDNSIVIVSGANSAWPEELPTALIDAIKNAAIVLVQCEIPVRVNALEAKAAAKSTVPIMWDTGGDDYPIPEECSSLADFRVPERNGARTPNDTWSE
ncbi:putative ribokinase [Phytophthora infestans]|uniref:Putative ribokinase n=1 Tax=Phytophthora infestans TaxID=4787 RepID=A0A8S9VBQ7_PHYIN|nr:putative ribokinase [Phytophthora infestans]